MKFLDWVKVILVSLVVFTVVVTFTWLKVEAYNGDPSCLFVKCVKVIK